MDLLPDLPASLPWIVQATWQASVLIVLIIVAQALCARWLAAQWRYNLWLLLPVVLLLPAYPSSVLSVHNVYQTSEPLPAVAAQPWDDSAWSTDAPPRSSREPRGEAGDSQPLTPAASPSDEAARPSLAVWLWLAWIGGAALYLLAVGWMQVQFWRRVRRGRSAVPDEMLALLDAVRRELGIRRRVGLVATGGIAGPCVAGVLRPTLLLPARLGRELSARQLRLIFLHELMHIKRHDLPTNVLFVMLQALHWFNPLIWYGFARLRAERELARDAMVLDAAGPGHVHTYGTLILDTLVRRPQMPVAASAALGNSSRQLQRRIQMIADHAPGVSFAHHAVAFVLLAALVAGACTTAAERTAEPPRLQADPRLDLANAPDHGEYTLQVAIFDKAFDEPAREAAEQKVAALRDQGWESFYWHGPDRSTVTVGVWDEQVLEDGTEAADEAAAGREQFPHHLVNDEVRRLGDGEPAPNFFVQIPRDEAAFVSRDAQGLLVRHYDLTPVLGPVASPLEHVLDPRQAATPEDAVQQARRQEAEAIAAIQRAVRERLGDPETWGEAGAVHRMEVSDRRLVVHTTEANHQRVQRVLEELEPQDPQVQAEFRYLLMDQALADRLLEGDLDVAAPVEVATPEGEAAPIAAYLLNDVQVDLLIRATMQAEDSQNIAAPQMLAWDGQAAWLVQQQQQQYVREFEEVDGHMEPVIDVVKTGPTIHAGGAVSEDRRYVELHFRLGLTTQTGPPEQEPVPYGPADEQWHIERPQLDKWELAGRASVPDLATLLVVGDEVRGSVSGDADADASRRVAVLMRPNIRIPQQATDFPALRQGP